MWTYEMKFNQRIRVVKFSFYNSLHLRTSQKLFKFRCRSLKIFREDEIFVITEFICKWFAMLIKNLYQKTISSMK